MRCIKWNGVVLAGLLSFGVHAHPYVDFYGVEPQIGNLLVKKYAKQIALIANSFLDFASKNAVGNNAERDVENLSQMKSKLELEMQQSGDFAYLNLDMIFYENPKLAYTTIEVVTKDDTDRMHYLYDSAKNNIHKPQAEPAHDVIMQMELFSAEVLRLFILGELQDIPDDQLVCPVYHCLASFDQPTLAPYLSLFNAAAIYDKALIIDTLKNDPVLSRRAAAVFLVGHFRDPVEIIQVLLPYVNDSSIEVRNNALRVLSSTLRISKINSIDPRAFLDLLNSPLDTDRNKSLFVLLAIAGGETAKNWLGMHGEKLLLANLALTQPNNHRIAYKILQKISGQSFGDRAMDDWHNWFVNHAQPTTITHRVWQFLLHQYRQLHI